MQPPVREAGPRPKLVTVPLKPVDIVPLHEQLGTLEANARANLARARRRLFELGLIDEAGEPTSDELPADMRPGSKTSSRTG